MAKKKKIEKKIEENVEEKVEVKEKPPSNPPAPLSNPKIPLNVYFSLKGIKKHWQKGMEAYKEAVDVGPKSKKEWEKFFESY